MLRVMKTTTCSGFLTYFSSARSRAAGLGSMKPMEISQSSRSSERRMGTAMSV